MKYWLYDGKDAAGPYEAEELKRLPGFTPESLICPDGAESADQWRPAQYYLIRPPATKDPGASSARAGQTARAKGGGMGRIAEAELEEARVEAPSSSAAQGAARPGAQSRRPSAAVLAALATLPLTAAAAYYMHRASKPAAVPPAPPAATANGSAPSQPALGNPLPVVSEETANEVIEFARRFPVPSASGNFPAAPEDALTPSVWRAPETLGEALEMRGNQSLAFAAAAVLQKQGHTVAAARREVAKNPERWEAYARRYVDEEVRLRWNVEPVTGSRYRVIVQARLHRGGAEDRMAFEADLVKRTMKPLDLDAWFLLDPKGCAKWGDKHVHIGEDVDPALIASAAPAYGIPLKRARAKRPRREAPPPAPVAKPAPAPEPTPQEDGIPDDQPAQRPAPAPVAQQRSEPPPSAQPQPKPAEAAKPEPSDRAKAADAAARAQDADLLEKALMGDQPADHPAPAPQAAAAKPAAPAPSPAAKSSSSDDDDDKADKNHKNAMDMSVDELKQYLNRR